LREFVIWSLVFGLWSLAFGLWAFLCGSASLREHTLLQLEAQIAQDRLPAKMQSRKEKRKASRFARKPAAFPRSDFPTCAPASDSLARSTDIREHGGDEVDDEPDIFVAHVLIDVDEDQHPGKEKPEKYVRPVGQAIRRIELRIEEYEDEKNKPREEDREEKKIKV